MPGTHLTSKWVSSKWLFLPLCQNYYHCQHNPTNQNPRPKPNQKIHSNPWPTQITKVKASHGQNQIKKLTAKPATTPPNHSTTQKNPQPKSQNSSRRTHNQRKSSRKINPPPLSILIQFKINKTRKKSSMPRNPERQWTTMPLPRGGRDRSALGRGDGLMAGQGRWRYGLRRQEWRKREKNKGERVRLNWRESEGTGRIRNRRKMKEILF